MLYLLNSLIALPPEHAMDLLITIPTYWCRPSPWRPGDSVYDHPTPLDSAGTLGRTLESLPRLQAEENVGVVVVAAATAPDLAQETERKVLKIIQAASPPMPVALFAQSHQDRLKQSLATAGQPKLGAMISLDGYSNIRNVCLLVGRLLDANAVVQIDDDEVFDDPHFLHRVRSALSAKHSGLAGYYVNGEGAYLLPEPREAWEQSFGKVRAMNEAFRLQIGASAKLEPTPFAFGGNMTITRQLYTRVPFDPEVPRGEDVDYLINADLDGHRFVLDNGLAITHLPPPHSHPAWQRLRQDVVRFAYERDKLAAAGVPPSRYDPYPGPFLGADLCQKVERACELLAAMSRQEGDAEGAARAEALAGEARALTFPDALDRYRKFQQRWQALMGVLQQLGPVHDLLTWLRP